MADQKVSDLPSLNGADVDPADLLYIIDSSAGSAGSKKITVGQYQLAPVSGGTANGVMYLDGSKVVTTGSALVFDGTNLGVGTNSPAGKVDAVSNAYAAFTARSSASGAGQTVDALKAVDSAAANFANAKYSATAHIWNYAGTTEGMRLDASGNLGLGVTPTSWISNAKAVQVGSFLAAWTGSNGSANLGFGVYEGGAVNTYRYLTTGDAPTMYQQLTGQHSWHTAPSGTAGNAISFTQAMTLDADGELGIGTTSPSCGLDVRKQETSAYNTARFSNGTDVQFLDVVCGRALTNGTVGGVSSSLVMTLRSSGSSAGHLAFATGNDERARITLGGNLLVGLSAATFVNTQLEVQAATNNNALGAKTTQNNYAPLMAWNSATTGDNLFQYFYTEGTLTLRGSIDYNRAGGLVRYNTTSDYRAKDIIGPITNSGEVIDSLKVYEGKMKGATQSRPMLIAHEAQAHAPYAVSGVKDEVNEDGTPKFQQMDVSSLVPLLLAEIQSLRARVAALESQ